MTEDSKEKTMLETTYKDRASDLLMKLAEIEDPEKSEKQVIKV